MVRVLEILWHKREQPPQTVTTKVKAKVLAHLINEHQVYLLMFAENLKHLEYHIIYPFFCSLAVCHNIILGYLISDEMDQRPLAPSYTFHLPALSCIQICHQLKGINVCVYLHSFLNRKGDRVVSLISKLQEIVDF